MSDSSPTNGESVRASLLQRIRALGPALVCPHCQSAIGSLPSHAESVVCPECASSFRVEHPGNSTTVDEPHALKRFRLLERVGNGTFGVVWRAFDTQLERMVALKIPHSSLLESEGFQTRFWREAQAAAALRHPGIVTVHEAIAEGAFTAIVSDFVEGVSLKEFLEVRRLTFDEAAGFVEDVARALHHAHEKGLVHRDVKPANIMIDFSGSAAAGRPSRGPGTGARQVPGLGRPLIVDFGLALRGEAEIVLTVDGQIVGTPAYMSPEQAAGTGHRADRRSDVYCLGVVLYELLCGELPFRGSRAMVVHQVIYEPPRSPRRINDKIPRDLEIICLKAMAKEPGWRYASASELADDLGRFLEGRPIHARHASRPEQVWRWCRRNPALAFAGGFAGAAAIGFITLLILFAVHKSQSVQSLTRLSASLALDHGLSQCEMGETTTGLLWLARSLLLAPPDAADLQRVIRLNLNSWNGTAARLAEFAPAETTGLNFLALAPDGTALLTVSEQNGLQLRHIEPGGEKAVTFQVSSPVVAACLTSKGSLIATGHADNNVRFWDGNSGNALGPTLMHAAPIVALGISRDGATVATAAADRSVRIWRVSDGTLIGDPLVQHAAVRRLAFSPNSELLVACCLKGKVVLWHLASGRKLSEFGDAATVWWASFSPDGKRLATAGSDRAAQIWDLSTGKLIGSPMPHQEVVRMVEFSPDGSLVVTASFDKTARLWSARSTRPAGPGLFHTTRVAAAAFHPDGRSLASVGIDGSVRRWQLAEGGSGQLLQHQSAIACVAMSHDGRRLVTASRAPGTSLEARLWDLESGQLVAPPIALAGSTVACAFDRADRLCVIATHDGTVFLVDATTGQIRTRIQVNDLLTAAILCCRDRFICTGTHNGEVRLWSTETGARIESSLSMSAPITALCGSPSRNSVLVGTQDGTVGHWTPESGDFQQETRHKAEVTSLAFGADRQTVISGSWDKTACIHLSTSKGKERNTYLRHDDQVRSLAVSPDGKLILTGSADHKVHFWDAATGNASGPALSHSGLVGAVKFTGGQMVVSGAWDGTIRLWDLTTRRPIGPRLEHSDSVQSVDAFPDTSTWVAGSVDGTARVWRVPTELLGDAARIALWCEVLTGMELDANDSVRVLDAATWNDRRRSLAKIGGPPTR
jgi:eukaryotic-like serine/threonine-protein kinase